MESRLRFWRIIEYQEGHYIRARIEGPLMVNEENRRVDSLRQNERLVSRKYDTSNTRVAKRYH